MRTDNAHAALGWAEELQTVASAILVPMRVAATRAGSFRASVESASAGPVTVARIRSSPHLVAREACAITSTDPDLLMVTLHGSGPATVVQESRQRRVAPGDLVTFDTGRPYRLDVTGPCDVIVSGLPRAMLGAHADLIARRTAAPLPTDTGARALVAAFLSGLGEQLDSVPASSGTHLADAMVALLIAAFAETSAERTEMSTPLTERIIAYVRANLGDPDLSVESVARRHGISPRHLHQLFRGRDFTFTAWVRHERLHRIRRDVTAPSLAHRTVAAIAASWGIHDADHLGRLFRAEFGHTAMEIRDAARTAPRKPAHRSSATPSR
ncbi:helix-turn-helix domain-containing protein [Streptomyces sp. NPDC060366]|uniref:AraC-like ligand-binding domain-containing protein n=1 Tax=Streptomyces sp. NPDC060366 TaxID=3347105 RepID=UPI00365EBB98